MRHIQTVIADSMRRLRRERGWSQATLAAAISATGFPAWSANKVALVETGKQRADRMADLAALCAAFQVPVTALLDEPDVATVQGSETIMLADDDASIIPVAAVRMALEGEWGPDAFAVQDAERQAYTDTLATLSQLDRADLAAVLLDLYGGPNDKQLDLLQIRDELAGVGRDATGTVASRKRGHGTRDLVAQIQAHIDRWGLDLIRQRANFTTRLIDRTKKGIKS